jgi:hypothetical protein
MRLDGVAGVDSVAYLVAVAALWILFGIALHEIWPRKPPEE